MRQVSLAALMLLVSTGCGAPAVPAKAKAKDQSQTQPKTATAMPESQPQTKAPAGPPVAKLTVRGPGIHEESVELPRGGKLLYTISVPADFKPGAPLVLALHYGGEVTPHYGRGLIESLVGPGFAKLGAVIVVPDARDGEDWTAAGNEQAAVWLTRSVAASYGTDPRRTAVTGYSMGGIGTWYLGSRYPQLFTAAIPVASRPVGKPDWKIPLYIIQSPADELFPLADVRNYADGLRAKGAQVELLEVPNLTHYQSDEYAEPMTKAAAWLVERWK